MKVRVFLKSGNHMDVECDKATFENDNNMNVISYSFIKPKGNLHINVKQIEAWQTIVE